MGRVEDTFILTNQRTLVELVRATTPDGCTLDGALARPAADAPRRTALDAVCLVPGTGSNFYGSTFFELLSERIVELGVAALRVNTRGHDGISTLVTAKGAIRQGAAFEAVDDCRHDLAAWTAWLREHVGPRIALLGHSLGAVKSLYAAAHAVDAAGIIAISPPRLSYSWFCQSVNAREFLDIYEKAERLVLDGQPSTLMEVKLPLPFIITAAGYREKYGPEERYNYLNFLHAVRCPTLVLFGSQEVDGNMAFQKAPDEVRNWQAKRPQLDVDVVDGADHFYTGRRDAAWERIAKWLANQIGDKGST